MPCQQATPTNPIILLEIQIGYLMFYTAFVEK